MISSNFQRLLFLCNTYPLFCLYALPLHCWLILSSWYWLGCKAKKYKQSQYTIIHQKGRETLFSIVSSFSASFWDGLAPVSILLFFNQSQWSQIQYLKFDTFYPRVYYFKSFSIIRFFQLAQNCQKEIKKSAIKSQKTSRDFAPRAKRMVREVTNFSFFISFQSIPSLLMKCL